MTEESRKLPDRHEDARPSNVRLTAMRRLLRIEEAGAFVGFGGGGEGEWGARDERQTMEYVAGVTRRRRWLDFILQHYYRGDLTKMEAPLRQILRIALYDLLYLDTPSYAAVHDAVDLAKQEVRRGAGGLVNGILRNVLRHRDELPRPSSGDDADDLAVRHSHPTWMVRRWLSRYGGADAERLLEWNNARPAFTVRVNTLRTTTASFRDRLQELGVSAEPARHLPDAFRVASVQPLLHAGVFDEGLCSVQDEGAGLIVQLLDPAPGERILDACAAPGGKAFYAAQFMADTGEITAVDVHEGRLRLVERGAVQLGITCIRTVAQDARVFRDDRLFDRVLLDAPCSGFGVLAKRADLRWNRAPEDLQELVALQDALLEAAAMNVRPGGVLVYGTCTIEPEENEERVTAFLRRHDDFIVERAQDYVPAQLVREDGFFATLPFRDGIDGAFGARLRRLS